MSEEEKLIDIETLDYKDIEEISPREFSFIYRSLKKSETTQLLEKLFFLLKEILIKKYANMPWSQIEEEFYQDKNIKRRYILIKAVIIEKHICNNRACFTNLNLDNIAERIDSLPKGVYDLESGKEEYGEKSENNEDFSEEIERYSRALTLIFQEVHKIFAVNNARKKAIEEAHARNMEAMEKMREYNIPYTKTIAKYVDDSIDRDEKILTGNEDEFLKDYGIFGSSESTEKNKKKGEKKYQDT